MINGYSATAYRGAIRATVSSPAVVSGATTNVAPASRSPRAASSAHRSRRYAASNVSRSERRLRRRSSTVANQQVPASSTTDQ